MIEFTSILQSISVIVACISVVLGVDTWRREFIGKRQIELAEDILALFYEANDAIARIRNPFSNSEEGKSRTRADHEFETDAKIRDRAYIVVERYEKESELFNKIRSLRYRIMARFSSEAAKPFDELNRIVNAIFLSSHMLGDVYWRRQGRVEMSKEQFEKHLKEMQDHEAVFWDRYESDDPIRKRLEVVVEQIEAICRPVIEQRSVGFILIEPIRAFRRTKQ